jgi:hypothetical protein
VLSKREGSRREGEEGRGGVWMKGGRGVEGGEGREEEGREKGEGEGASSGEREEEGGVECEHTWCRILGPNRYNPFHLSPNIPQSIPHYAGLWDVFPG